MSFPDVDVPGPDTTGGKVEDKAGKVIPEPCLQGMGDLETEMGRDEGSQDNIVVPIGFLGEVKQGIGQSHGI